MRSRTAAKLSSRQDQVGFRRQRTGSLVVWILVLVATVATASVAAALPSGPFEICEGQRYALCATARCFVFDQVAYCKCDIEFGDSISEADSFDGGDVCSVNAEGVENGYMVSTYSLPDSVVGGGDQALYTCLAKSSDGAYAQCDGGICFESTQGNSFPGFDAPLAENEVICSCPITVADPETAKIGYQVVGPYPCQEEFFDNCKKLDANTRNGSAISVGAPTGVPRFLTRVLDGSVPPLNRCAPPR